MKPLQVGITGGIGAGKTIVTKIFSLLGIPIYDADSNAKWLMVNDKPLIEKIINHFGNEAYLSDGSLNKKYLSEKAFGAKNNIADLNAIVHPAVKNHYQNWVDSNSHAPYVLKEAAILFESSSHKQLDKVIMVSASKELRIQRTLARDQHRSKNDILAIIEKQMPEEDKIKLADFVIYNNDTQLIIPQVVEIDKLLRAK